MYISLLKKHNNIARRAIMQVISQFVCRIILNIHTGKPKIFLGDKGSAQMESNCTQKAQLN